MTWGWGSDVLICFCLSHQSHGREGYLLMSKTFMLRISLTTTLLSGEIEWINYKSAFHKYLWIHYYKCDDCGVL
jgi:hypothetical protein